MSARDVIEHALHVYYADSQDPKALVSKLLALHHAEVLHTTPLFLAEYDSVESEVHLTLDDARAMCDDIAAAVRVGGQGWDWSRNEDGVYVQFWTHEDDDRPLHMTGGTVTETRVQHPVAEQGEKDTPTGESTPQPAGTCGRALSTGQPCPDHPVNSTELIARFRVEHVTTRPEHGFRRAIGWTRTCEPDSRWHGDFQDESDFECWTEATAEDGDAR